MVDQSMLYICPTPIGNLEDITLRVLKVLEEVDLIAAEDTRRTLKLLNHYNIKTPITSYFEHNKREKGRFLIRQLNEGKNVALVSDAGTPGISDPGQELIITALEQGIKVVPLPGATAMTTALVASGLSTDRFFFQGFLPRDAKRKRICLEELKDQVGTIILYASPHRVMDDLKNCEKVLGNRKMVVARELTKKFEEFIRGQISEIIEIFKNKDVKGELVLLIEGTAARQKKEAEPWLSMSVKEHILWNMQKGLSKKEAIRRTAQERDMPKRQVYAESLNI